MNSYLYDDLGGIATEAEFWEEYDRLHSKMASRRNA